jgi:aerobic-type carbon monoxide dehydrogenase small subunit (CoxS/CutS family)
MNEKQTYTLTVNGERRQVVASPQTMLMDALRDQLRLTGTKDGCAVGHCGSCMALKDGEAVRSCIVPMKRVDGAEIVTIEGVAAPDGALHPVQQAYIDQGATQCGFCTPGFIISTIALLEKNPNPTLEEIYDGHKWNICRCTGHNAIIRAVQQAAGQSVASLPSVKQALNAISQPLPRPDAVEKVNGKGIYADDLYVEGMLHARALRSKYPHARLLRVDVSKAKEHPGVAAAITAGDIPGRKDCGVHEVDWPVLCYDKVRYVGDAIALVVAESEEIAAEALKLIEVDYEPLPVITGPKEAALPDAPILHEHVGHEHVGHEHVGHEHVGHEHIGHEHTTGAAGEHGNCLKHYHLENGDLAKGFAEADTIIEREYRTQTVEHASSNRKPAWPFPIRLAASLFIAGDRFRSATAARSPRRSTCPKTAYASSTV